MNFKRKKSRRNIRCTMCTPHRWRGNGSERHTFRSELSKEIADEKIKDYKESA